MLTGAIKRTTRRTTDLNYTRRARLRMACPILRLCCAAAILVALPGAATAFGSESKAADAVEKRDQDALRRLLQQHVDVNLPQADGGTALHWAAHWNDVDVIGLLIAAGANVNAVNQYGVTPLSIACANG